jgi:S-adenosylmethionine-diacylglycerol 3-amino-3-carboxypropyl transferase
MLYFLGVRNSHDQKEVGVEAKSSNGQAGEQNHSRLAIYSRMRMQLSQRARQYFDKHSQSIECGVINQGKLERYFTIFRRRILPLVKNRQTIMQLLTPKRRNERQEFYRRHWGTHLYNILFKMFFSRFSMALLGREKCFFQYATEGLSSGLLQASKTALIEQEPARNPYLHWILTGNYGPVLPHYLRPENFEAIKANLPALIFKHGRLDQILAEEPEGSIDGFNLSDVFEYLSPDVSATLAQLIVRASKKGARMVYWNMLVDRKTADYCPNDLQVEEDYSTSLAAITKTFFYKRLLVERVCK